MQLPLKGGDTNLLGSVVEWNVTAQIVARIDLARPRDLLFGIEKHFLPLRDPPRSAGNREKHREHGYGETHRLVDQAGVEIDVGIKLPLDEVFVLQSDSFAFQGDIDQWIPAHDVEDLVGHALHYLGARIVILVNAVAEA